MHVRTLVLAAAVLVAARTAPAQTAVPLLVEPEWLSQHAADPGLVILHLGRDYGTRHIPGAREMTQGDVSLDRLAALGVSDGSHIVLYAVGTEIPAMAMFAFDEVGLGDRVSLLNGGLQAWTAAGKPVTAEPVRGRPGRLTPRPRKELIVDADFVRSLAQRPNHRLVDARAPVFYQGIEGMHGKAGHLPGAVNIPFSDIGDERGRIDRSRLERMFRDAGINPGDTVVAYCHIGQQARWAILGARILGHPVRLYAGSFHDWTSNDRGPVVK